MTRAPSSLSAYVLHSHAWSETSLILELFSREQGRLLVVAKGAKRPYSQMRAAFPETHGSAQPAALGEA